MSRKRLPELTDDRGFVLIIVIWGLGLVLVLAASFAVSTRSFTKTTANRTQLVYSETHADTGVHLALMALMASRVARPEVAPPIPLNGETYSCTIADGVILAISVEDEGGKVDLNAASPAMLVSLFQGFGADLDRAMALADALLDFRDDDDNKRPNGGEAPEYEAAGLSISPKNAPLQAPEELEQVMGIDAELYRAIRPYVTVHSRRSGVDPGTAAPPLLAALTGEPPADFAHSRDLDAARQTFELRRGFITPSERSVYTIRVEVRRPEDGLFVREAIVELPRHRNPPYRYLAWRQGERRALDNPYQAEQPDACFRQ